MVHTVEEAIAQGLIDVFSINNTYASLLTATLVVFTASQVSQMRVLFASPVSTINAYALLSIPVTYFATLSDGVRT